MGLGPEAEVMVHMPTEEENDDMVSYDVQDIFVAIKRDGVVNIVSKENLESFKAKGEYTEVGILLI